jgi:MFS family permease
MVDQTVGQGWQSLLRREWMPIIAVLLGGVLLQSMNVLLVTTVLPSIVAELGGLSMLSWPTTAYLAASIAAASCAGALATAIGPRRLYCIGVTTFAVGSIVCALAPAMGWIVAGRLVQGFGGGLEAATAYVVIRATFPEQIWSRTIALLTTSWSVSVLLGPLVGGTFASLGSWRGAFATTAVIAAVLAVAASVTLPPAASARRVSGPGLPIARVALICCAIAAASASSVAPLLLSLGLIVIAIVALATMLKLDRGAINRLLPRDAFSWRTPTGVGLWLGLLVGVSYSPLQLFVPLFLQQLHGLNPLAAGFSVAAASLGWTGASLATAGATRAWADRFLIAGPLLMGVSLAALALLIPAAPTLPIIPAIILLGVGIGQCWPFIAHRVMAGAQTGDETVAASSVPTIQQVGLALGAAFAGVIASASGLSAELTRPDLTNAAFWVPIAFVAFAVLGCVAALRLVRLSRA